MTGDIIDTGGLSSHDMIIVAVIVMVIMAVTMLIGALPYLLDPNSKPLYIIVWAYCIGAATHIRIIQPLDEKIEEQLQ